MHGLQRYWKTQTMQVKHICGEVGDSILSIVEQCNKPIKDMQVQQSYMLFLKQPSRIVPTGC